MAGIGTTDIVADASVLLKTAIPEDLRIEAHAVLGILRGRDRRRVLVPDLLYAEAAHGIWKQVVRGRRSPAAMRAALLGIDLLDLTVVPTRELAHAALKIALDRGITAYDAAYVALSDREEVPLVTADRKLLGRLEGTPHRIRWLGDFEP